MAFEKIKIRNYDWKIDKVGVEDLERRCEVGPMEHVFLFTDTLGDPISRIRNTPIYNMLVAELNNTEIVGVIQGCIKLVTICKSSAAPKDSNSVAKVGYILGLRVSPLHRRKGIAISLVHQMEEWLISRQVDYAYMATEKDNDASTNLFINKLGYVKFRTPSILVHPVINRPFPLSQKVQIVKLKIQQAEFLYRKFMSSVEFFPHDINRILKNKLSLGTWIAFFRGEDQSFDPEFGDLEVKVPKTWAMLSVWKSSEVFKLRVGKPTLSCMLYSKMGWINRAFPCFKLSALPDFFDPFGFLFMYGIYREGRSSGKLVRALCKFVHNLATEEESFQDCKAIVTEVAGGGRDSGLNIPHWKLLSCPEDLWCIKALKYQQMIHLDDLTRTPQKARPLFVDPREV